MVLILTGTVVLAQPAAEDKNPPSSGTLGAMAAPPIGPFINIWADTVENYNPAVAYNSRRGEFLVVWEDSYGAQVNVHARIVTRDGTRKNDFIVASNPNQMNWLPDVAYSPVEDEYLVVYTYNLTANDYDIWGRRISGDGSSMSSEFAINTDTGKQWYPAVAYNSANDEYLVVYENYWSNSLRDIAAQRIKASGGSLLSWRNIATAPNTIRRLPDVAYNAERNEYLIAYTYQTTPLGDSDIRGRISDASMSTLSGELQITPSGAPPQDGVALAAGPDEYLAVWGEDYGASKASIWGRRVGGTGSLNFFIKLADDAGKRRVEPAVGFGQRGRYLVAWRYEVGGSQAWDVYARTVLEGQNSPEDVEFIVDDTMGSQRSPAVACVPSGPCLVVYEDNWPGTGSPDFDIGGHLVGYSRAFLPTILRRQ
jgi:hypothetical protein